MKRGMGTVDEAPLDAAGIRVWTRVFATRAAVVLFAAVTSFPVGTLEGRNVVLLVLMIPYVGLQTIRFRRVRRLERYVPIADMLVAGAFALVEPAALPAIAAIGPAIVAFGVVMFGWRTAVLTGALGGTLLAVAAARTDGDNAVALMGYLVGTSLVLISVAYAHHRERWTAKRYADLINGIDGIVWEWDPEAHRLSLVSTQVENVLGWSVEEAHDLETWRRHAVDADFTPDKAVEAALTGGAQTVEFAVRHADGHVVWLRNRLRVRRAADGSLDAVQGILVDTTELRANRLAVQQLADVVENMHTATTLWQIDDPDHPEHARLVRRTTTPVGLDLTVGRVGDAMSEIFPMVVGTSMVDHIRTAMVRGEQTVAPVVRWPDEHGAERWYTRRILPLAGNCFAILTDDVTEQRQAEDTLRYQALHDALTGLPNRALVSDRLARSLSQARRTNEPVALLIMDLDQFKEVNDTLGHPVGDKLLVEVGARLAQALRDCDTVARLGGDEFAVLLTTDATHAGTQRVAERIQREIARPYELDGVTVRSAASIGIAISPAHGEDAGTLTQHADIAMYNAKRLGSGWAFYTPDDDHTSVRRLAYANELDDALTRDEFLLHYQPQVDLVTGEVVAIEGLVRWRHPEQGILLPIEFIEVAEVCGAIQRLTHWVVGTAISQAAQLSRAGHDLAVSVNLSGRNLYDPTLAGHIGRSLEDFDVDPHRLVLELTERELVEDPSQVMSALSLVAELGVRVAIDDFGTGWSSIANLTRLPVHQLKVDRSFVSRMMDDAHDGVIVQSIIDLGHNLGFAVIAEGVETEATIDELQERGCDLGQGYLVGKPMTAERLTEWLEARGRDRAFRPSGT
jgi:diguanylate cyclase (GGDEF)-like protein/PAS domain S-box-containing protein